MFGVFKERRIFRLVMGPKKLYIEHICTIHNYVYTLHHLPVNITTFNEDFVESIININ